MHVEQGMRKQSLLFLHFPFSKLSKKRDSGRPHDLRASESVGSKLCHLKVPSLDLARKELKHYDLYTTVMLNVSESCRVYMSVEK